MSKFCLLFITSLFLLSCVGPSLEHHAQMMPKADIKAFFNGPIKAWGIIQDSSGDVVSRFDVDMIGSWEGNKGTLKEDFVYYNGSTDQRIWYITKHKDGTYTGRADDIIDEAHGEERGNAVRWKYRMNVPVGDNTYEITLDDWMWQMNDGVLINRSYLKTFGFTVAELTLFMQKQDKK